MAKRGRPRGVNLNPAAVEDLLAVRCMSKTELCAEVGLSSGHFSDMLSRREKGASPEIVRRMAEVLRCQPATIAPEIDPRFVFVRSGDPEPETAAVA